jgi:hypothetical protein
MTIALNRFNDPPSRRTPSWQSRPQLLISEEPSLAEVLKEPIILALMASDGVTRRDILALAQVQGRTER